MFCRDQTDPTAKKIKAKNLCPTNCMYKFFGNFSCAKFKKNSLFKMSVKTKPLTNRKYGKI